MLLGYILLEPKSGEIAFLVPKEEAHTAGYLDNFHNSDTSFLQKHPTFVQDGNVPSFFFFFLNAFSSMIYS